MVCSKIFLSLLLIATMFSANFAYAVNPEISKPQELRDNRGILLGKIKQRGDGKFEGRDAKGRLKGIYDSKTNQTRDSRGRLVGTGNLLSILVVAP